MRKNPQLLLRKKCSSACENLQTEATGHLQSVTPWLFQVILPIRELFIWQVGLLNTSCHLPYTLRKMFIKSIILKSCYMSIHNFYMLHPLFPFSHFHVTRSHLQSQIQCSVDLYGNQTWISCTFDIQSFLCMLRALCMCD